MQLKRERERERGKERDRQRGREERGRELEERASEWKECLDLLVYVGSFWSSFRPVTDVPTD